MNKKMLQKNKKYILNLKITKKLKNDGDAESILRKKNTPQTKCNSIKM